MPLISSNTPDDGLLLMRIAVFGSSHSSTPVGDAITDASGMADFCGQLGRILAEFPYSLLVETDTGHTTDGLVANSVVTAPQRSSITIWVYYQPGRRHDLPFARQSSENPGRFIFKPLPTARTSASHMRILRDADVAIIVGGGGNSYAAGLAASLLRVRLIPVATFGGAGRLLWQQLSDQLDSPVAKLPSRSTWDNLSGTPEMALEVIRREIASLPRIMVVHGRSNDRQLVEQLLLVHGVTDPIVLRERFTVGKTIPEKFEREALQADGAVVLFTPDDEAAALLGTTGQPISTDEIRRRMRARQNVSLEYGWFWGRLGRDRVLLLLKGELELPSDLVGLPYHSYQDNPEECSDAVADFIKGIRDR